MTRAEKIEWLAQASSEELVEQLESSVLRYNRGAAYDRENKEDLQLTRAELLKRLSK